MKQITGLVDCAISHTRGEMVVRLKSTNKTSTDYWVGRGAIRAHQENGGGSEIYQLALTNTAVVLIPS